MNDREPLVIRPRKYSYKETIPVTIRVPDIIYNKLESVAGKTGHNRSEIMIMCLQYALDNLKLDLEE